MEDRHSTLLGVKLRALAAEHLDAPIEAEPATLPHGVALRHEDAAWVLLEGDAQRGLGAALAWAIRHDARSLEVVAESGGGVLARRAAAFTLPTAVWYAQERTLLPVVAEPLVPPPRPREEHLAFAPMIAAAGADPNVEHGVVFGEVRGLEVCRVVDQPTTGFFAEPGMPVPMPAAAGGLQLEVGVGATDREAFQMLHGDVPTPDALASVVASVATHRAADAGQHPLNRLGRERFLRWRAIAAPASVGLAELRVAEPPLPRPNLKDPVPCVAIGTADDGAEVVVVFSAGVDVDLLPFVADVQAMYDRLPIVVAVTARDDVALTRDLAALLRAPIEFVTLDA